MYAHTRRERYASAITLVTVIEISIHVTAGTNNDRYLAQPALRGFIMVIYIYTHNGH